MLSFAGQPRYVFHTTQTATPTKAIDNPLRNIVSRGVFANQSCAAPAAVTRPPCTAVATVT